MTRMTSDYERIDLWKGDQMFAIQDIDPKVGRISTKWTHWHDIVDDEGNPTAFKNKTTVQMTDCRDFLPGGIYENEYSDV